MSSVMLNERNDFQPAANPATSSKRFAPACALLLMSALSGCATFDESFDMCQSAGCSADTKIATDVRTNLQQRSELEGSGPLQVQTINHVVYLNGIVSVGQERAEAESVALQTPGVTQVVNNIAVSK
ncbi:MAG TPA: BON domain-containing protein [Steroidobacteraceae bacterium]